MLRIKDLTVEVSGKTILKDFSLNIDKGEVHVLLGPNGAGKTTLIKTIMGFKNYKVVKGEIWFKGKEITHLPINERVKLGIGVLFQHPPAINGVKLIKLLSVCQEKKKERLLGEKAETGKKHNNDQKESKEDLEELYRLAKELKFDKSYLNRDVNLNFSGGEVKRSEILQMLVMEPDLLLFDEPDSGVDVENVELIAKVMRKLLDRDKVPSKQSKSGLIITHLGYILKFLGHITRAHIVMDGQIQCSGDPHQIMTAVIKNGFEGCKNCLTCTSTSILPDPEEVHI